MHTINATMYSPTFPLEILHSSIHSSKRSRNRKQGGYLRKEAHFVSWIFPSFKKLEVVKPNMTHHKVNAQTKISTRDTPYSSVQARSFSISPNRACFLAPALLLTFSWNAVIISFLLSAWMSKTRSSIDPSTTSLHTVVGLVWPKRWTRSTAWSYLNGQRRFKLILVRPGG